LNLSLQAIVCVCICDRLRRQRVDSGHRSPPLAPQHHRDCRGFACAFIASVSSLYRIEFIVSKRPVSNIPEHAFPRPESSTDLPEMRAAPGSGRTAPMSTSPTLRAQVLAVLHAATGQALKAKDVSKVLGLSHDDRGDIRHVLFDLVDEGLAVQLPGRRFASAAAERPDAGIKGTVQRKPSGIGWFVPHDKSRKDAFLPPDQLRGVVDGDVVLARIERAPRGPIATIVKVVERGRTTVTGTLHTGHDRRFGRVRFVEVDDNMLSGPVRITDDGEGDKAKEGDVVEVELTKPPTTTTPAEGRILRRIGKKGALDVEIERLVVQAGVNRAFPPAVLGEAGQLGEVPGKADFVGREDLRELPIVTIDGETAKDFDDAVWAKKRPRQKKIDVIVCVADVSHYVQYDAPLDREARARGTSIYYPGRVIPMLPEALSNGLCSLRPRVPRLCTVVEFSVDEQGGVHDERLYFGVMQSRARLTYSLVQRFLDEEEGKDEPYALPKQPPEATLSTGQLDDETKESLRALTLASRRLREARKKRGALDFELPELVVELDEQKEPTGLRHNVRVESQKLIEDLMIAANEAAARFFDEQNFPSVYRIHEEPDDEKLGRFLDLARPAWTEQTKKPLPKNVLDDPTSPHSLMTLMHGIGEHPSRQALDMLLLRSMKQARYSVDNVGHYGLGSTAYLHFTSPIRRYPDLIVHRLLRERLAAGKRTARKKKPEDKENEAAALVQELEDIAETSSERERKAAELERQIQQLHACWLMKERIGEIHEAMITGCSEAGAFVRLTELHVEGLIRIDALGREYFDFDADNLRLVGARSREVLGIGGKVTVEVADVDLTRRQISFIRVPDTTAKSPVKGKKKTPARHATDDALARVDDADDDVEDVKPWRTTPRAPTSPSRPHRGRAAPPPAPAAAIDSDDDDDLPALPPKPRPARHWEKPNPRGPREPVAVSGIRGPDDLRALFDRLGPSAQKSRPGGKPARGRHGDDAPSSSRPGKAPHGKPAGGKPGKPAGGKPSKASSSKPKKVGTPAHKKPGKRK
jgi:ribonuclease R